MKMLAWIVSIALFLSLGCRDGGDPDDGPNKAPDGVESSAENSQQRSASTQAPPITNSPTVVFLGDSLTAGYGLDEDQSFPALIDEILRQGGWSLRVVNAGVSGDTTAAGLRRLDWLLRQEPAVLVLALGANDGLRGLPLEESKKTLRKIIERSQAAGAKVILAGMKVPPNYGPDYARDFEDMYPSLAEEFDLQLIEFLLEGVAGDPELNQADGIHPNAEGQRRTAENVLQPLLRALEQIGLEPDSAS